MSKTRTDAMELAVAMKNMYVELTPDLPQWARTEMVHWLSKSILGEAHGLWESYAMQMIYWLERNIKTKQREQFKAVQNGLIEFGVIPGPRKEEVGMGSWVASVYDGETWTEFEKEFTTSGKHGAHRIAASECGSKVDVVVFDNTEDGITEAEALEIAESAVRNAIYWSDDRLCHWMFDRKAAGHWYEGLFHNNGLPDEIWDFDPLHVNVYE